jgi:hypothetical protein
MLAIALVLVLILASEVHSNAVLQTCYCLGQPAILPPVLNPEEAPHPYGYPVEGALMWESDEDFLNACTTNSTWIRVGAFQTTLPDPLPGEEANVAHGAELLKGTIVSAGKVFSMNATIGPYTLERGFKEGPTYKGTQVIKTIGGGVCKLATTLYNVTVLADLKVVERRPHSMQVPYTPAGQDATVATGVSDFKFRNTSDGPLLIWAGTRENTLYIAFYGCRVPPQVTWHHEVLSREDYPTVYYYNPSLAEGQEQVIISGAEGLAVRSWLTLKYPDGTVQTRNLGVDYYRPMPRVVQRGTR